MSADTLAQNPLFQPTTKLPRAAGRSVRVELRSRQPTDLEVWDAEREGALFRQVFGKRLEIAVRR